MKKLKELKEYISEGILDIADSNKANESLLDMDEESADIAVENKDIINIIKKTGSLSIKNRQPHTDSLGHELKVGDVVVAAVRAGIKPGIILGFNDFSDGMRCEIDFDGKMQSTERYYYTCKDTLKIPSYKILKEIV